MDWKLFYTQLAPFIAAILASVLTYFFGLRSKKYDMMFQQIVPMVKDVNDVLVELKKYCYGQCAAIVGNEYAPYFEENNSILSLRRKLADIAEKNGIFISKNVRVNLDELEDTLSIACNFEAGCAGLDINEIDRNEKEAQRYEYERIISLTNHALHLLHKELHFPSRWFKFVA